MRKSQSQRMTALSHRRHVNSQEMRAQQEARLPFLRTAHAIMRRCVILHLLSMRYRCVPVCDRVCWPESSRATERHIGYPGAASYCSIMSPVMYISSWSVMFSIFISCVDTSTHTTPVEHRRAPANSNINFDTSLSCLWADRVLTTTPHCNLITTPSTVKNRIPMRKPWHQGSSSLLGWHVSRGLHWRSKLVFSPLQTKGLFLTLLRAPPAEGSICSTPAR